MEEPQINRGELTMTTSHNCLHYYLGLLQTQMNAEHAVQSESTLKALNNIIRSMQTSYHYIMRREDLSFFDFEKINANNLYLNKERNELLSIHDDNIKQDCLHYYCSLLKGKSFDESGSALPNIIQTMKLSRHNKVLDEDFSNLDFGNIPFNGIKFSISGDNPCKFINSVLNEANFQSGHSGAVKSVAWSPDGKFILSGSDDCTAILWDAESGLMIMKLKGHSDFIRSVAFSCDGQYCNHMECQ